MSIQHLSKPQPTLMGYTSWAFDRLVESKAQSAATVAAQIIDAWFDSSREELETLWNIRFEDWEKERALGQEIEAEVNRRVAAELDKESQREEKIEKEVQARLSKARGPRKVSG